jgi:hypothetical protein
MLKHRGAPGSSSEGVVIPVADMQGSKSRSSSGRKQENDGSGFLRLLWTFALMAASGYGGYAYFQASVFDSLVSSHRNQMATERSLADDLKSRLAAAESESAQLRSALATAKAEAAESAAGVAAQASETEKKEAKLKQLVAYKKKIHSGLQQYAKQRLLEKFGPDPHRVEIQLAYDPSSNIYSAEGGDRIVIEMAPSDEMPFTVFWFLSQVDRGLYNLTSFHRNARHGRLVLARKRADGSSRSHNDFLFSRVSPCVSSCSSRVSERSSLAIGVCLPLMRVRATNPYVNSRSRTFFHSIGRPIANFLTPPNSHLVDRFVKSGLDSVLFQEYSEKFPHVKYTLGYAGRPGGPDFYISTLYAKPTKAGLTLA